MQARNERAIVGTFHDVAAFEQALDALLKAGFDGSLVSILGNHQAIVDHFGQVPPTSEMADAPDTPSEALDTEIVLRKATDFIAGTLALISEVGAAAAAYAVGGPIGVAAGSADLADNSVEHVLSRYIGDRYRERFQESIRDGGMICWVHAREDAAVEAASRVLTAAGAENVHTVMRTVG